MYGGTTIYNYLDADTREAGTCVGEPGTGPRHKAPGLIPGAENSIEFLIQNPVIRFVKSMSEK